MSKKYTQDDFLRMAREAHPADNLDYSKSVFRKMKEDVCIVCHEKDEDGVEHGAFWQRAEKSYQIKTRMSEVRRYKVGDEPQSPISKAN